MKIVVCIKQVPDTNDVKIDPKTGNLIREGLPVIINPADDAKSHRDNQNNPDKPV